MTWSWAWAQYRDFAIGIAAIFWGFAFLGLARMAWDEPVKLLRSLCGGLAIFFGMLALLWAAHLSDKYF